MSVSQRVLDPHVGEENILRPRVRIRRVFIPDRVLPPLMFAEPDSAFVVVKQRSGPVIFVVGTTGRCAPRKQAIPILAPKIGARSGKRFQGNREPPVGG